MYEIYAWGVPSVIATIAVVFDNLPQGTFPSILKPKFAVRNCWFYGRSIHKMICIFEIHSNFLNFTSNVIFLI